MRFAKGHGTENDFVILPDPEARIDLPPQRVAALCDRRAGVGADGVLRVVRTAALCGQGMELPELGSDVEWFMDYRNADGSLAEMCGNGVRVFARYLAEAGWVRDERFSVGTRAGAREVTLDHGGDVTVDMGSVSLHGSGNARLAGTQLSGIHIDVGNPHLACSVPGPVAEIPLEAGPELDPETFPSGGNLEVFQVVEPGMVDMRVYERGSGETRSCGTGVVAVAAAADPESRSGAWRVRVPGGECTVYREGPRAWLRGPAVIVAEGEVRL
ncbi:diaminopimelate epimerase [Lipingzhangella sp. LS1_29]|uniref:Diaminopimelate epimerase n=1 Tax=Lipingzhangella rawalii TaxID=2055835 RepID=A0ABU2H8P6_9ACTN|nr:diaminopimelate epimerase [Lipingzhangella rawalii]MDS1271671.1 diaminopimelate epimerase [Lipingzhangella rawalii]